MANQNQSAHTSNSSSDGPKIPKGRALTFTQRMRAYLLAGILITAPISITFYLAWIFIGFVDSKITPLIPAQYNPETYLPFALPGLGLLILILALILTGALTAGFFGRLWLRISERILARMPVIRSVYGAVKQILETILAKQSNAFREAVLVEYPRRGLWAVAFITGRTEGEVQNITEEECTNIFLPTTPNPTSGFLLFVPKKDLISLSMSVEEAIKMVISGGIVTPPDRRSNLEKNKSFTSATTYETLEVLREKDGSKTLVEKGKRPGEIQTRLNAEIDNKKKGST
ncbi:MAG: hypothetical protein CBB68_11835 [Rhodospirillaceae bacterium TMED8]|nr:hypothetical protein [Magnetovibrio sp.]OUT49521.1 MAG: hypothetical protein CBB68_11835 [Rhodospirillaceae bacterium TMED8]